MTARSSARRPAWCHGGGAEGAGRTDVTHRPDSLPFPPAEYERRRAAGTRGTAMNRASQTVTRLGAAMAMTVAAALTAVATGAQAQSAGAPDSPAGLDTLIVTATRTPIPASESLVPVTVITREQIERSLATDVLDLLRFEAGLDVARAGGPGQAAAVFVRGSESNHALVLIDGVRINPGTIGAAPLQNLAPSVIQRIEIVKGVRSSLYGTDAIGGVINIITRGGRERSETAVRSGSFDTRQIQR